jgi:hypothetical protein
VTHRIERREAPGKSWLLEYRCNGGEWFRAANLYDAARKLQARGVAGPAQSFAANGTLSFEGSIEAWAQLMVIETDRKAIRVAKWTPSPWA